ncbi:MAG: hypothetical protein NG737_03860 [Omnitrophica bacterium]|nr:hypothetical protein [Candidatus Omnitrophota bacterium]
MKLIDRMIIKEKIKQIKTQSILEYLLFMVWVIVTILVGTGLLKVGVARSLDSTGAQMQADFFQEHQNGVVNLEIE